MKISFFFKKENNRLLITDESSYRKWVQSLDDGVELRADFLSIKDLRTEEQNNLYWALLDKLAKLFDDPEITKKQLHKYFRYNYLAVPESVLGDDIVDLPSTTELSKKEFVEYIEKIIRYGIERFGVVLLQDDWKEIFKTKIKRK